MVPQIPTITRVVSQSQTGPGPRGGGVKRWREGVQQGLTAQQQQLTAPARRARPVRVREPRVLN